MDEKGRRIWAAIQAGLFGVLLGVGVWYIAGRCGGSLDDISLFARISDLWFGLLNAGVMLVAGGLLAMTFTRIDQVFGLNGRCNGHNGHNSEETGE